MNDSSLMPHPIYLITADKNLHRNVFLMPPYPYKEKYLPTFESTAIMISSYTCNCSLVNDCNRD